jgi:succinoglycan biosynthesis transport protein ExoP
VGLVTGVGLAFFFEYLDNTIRVPEDIKRHFNIPYLGPVPAMAMGRDGNPDEENRPEMVTLHNPKSTASESYRGIRTSILFSSAETEPKVILISSAGPQEGKTITAANLAITMAQSENKVIMLDCDMRRPKVHKVFGISRDQGMSNILVGNKDMDGILIHTEIPNLDVIPCGPIPPNPSEMLGSTRMKKLLEMLRKDYSHIIIDSPPITAVTDAVVLAKSTDGVVLVIRANDTAREMIKNGLNQMQAVGANVLGAVLNGVDMGRDSYYYYQYYYYYYGEDGEGKRKAHKKKRSKSRDGE